MPNNFIRNRWADITGYQTVNGALVHEFVRTDPSGPIWSLRCPCAKYFTVQHSRISAALESGAPVYCDQCIVPTAESISLKEIRRDERRAKHEESERQAHAAQKSAQEQAEREHLNSFQADHHRYALQQINQGTPLEEIMSLERFAAQGDEVRKRIMDAVAKAGG